MSHFYGTLKGTRGKATRCGSIKSGMETYCASWAGAVRCFAYVDEETKQDWVVVSFATWQGRGERRELYRGPIGGIKV